MLYNATCIFVYLYVNKLVVTIWLIFLSVKYNYIHELCLKVTLEIISINNVSIFQGMRTQRYTSARTKSALGQDATYPADRAKTIRSHAYVQSAQEGFN